MPTIKEMDYNTCTGCSACVNICPSKCISLKLNDEGFYYPIINDDLCKNCSLCVKACPLNIKSSKENHAIKVYAYRNPNNLVRKGSTSGGFFTCISDYVIKHEGVVCAVGFNDDAIVTHIFVEKKSQIGELTGSKYVQSLLNNQFIIIRNYLEHGRLVLFVGTPCQIHGLVSYLNLASTNIEKLFLVQLKCYGVPSPGLFEKYKKYLEEKYHSKVKKVAFRDKRYGYYSNVVAVQFANETEQFDNYHVKSYSKTFFSGLNIRNSCYFCKFRSVFNSPADFIIGDLHDVDMGESIRNDDLGTTLVYALSEKAKLFIEKADGHKRIEIPRSLRIEVGL